MKRTTLILAPIALVVILINSSCERNYRERGCESFTTVTCGNNDTLVNIRLTNETDYFLCAVRIAWSDTVGSTIFYGNMKPKTASCYTAFVNPKLYPRIIFEIGEITYWTPDSLQHNLPYRLELIKDAGYYTCRLTTLGELNLGQAGAVIFKD